MSTGIAASNADSAARPPARSTGMAPSPVMTKLENFPFTPVPVKYSDLAQKARCRGTTVPSSNSSATERWLPAKIAPPVAGMCSNPSTVGRKANRSAGATVSLPMV